MKITYILSLILLIAACGSNNPVASFNSSEIGNDQLQNNQNEERIFVNSLSLFKASALFRKLQLTEQGERSEERGDFMIFKSATRNHEQFEIRLKDDDNFAEFRIASKLPDRSSQTSQELIDTWKSWNRELFLFTDEEIHIQFAPLHNANIENHPRLASGVEVYSGMMELEPNTFYRVVGVLF